MYSTVVDRCLRLVYQPPGLSSCRSIGMNLVFFNMVLPKIRLSQLLPGAFKSPLKSQTFVQIQGTFHFLPESHAALQHHQYIKYPCHWKLCQGRHGLREVQWTAPPLAPDLLRGHQAHLSLWFRPRTAQTRKMLSPSGPSRKLAQHQLLESISTERRNSMTSVGGIQCKQKVNYISEFPTSASIRSVVFVSWVFLLLRNNLSGECTLS